MQISQVITLVALLSTAASLPAADHEARQLGAPVGVIGANGKPSVAFVGAEPPAATAGAGAGTGTGAGAGAGPGTGAKGAKKAGQACNNAAQNGAQAPNPTVAAVAARQLGAPVGVIGANGQPSVAFVGAEPPAATAGANAGKNGKKAGANNAGSQAANNGQNQGAKKATPGGTNCAN